MANKNQMSVARVMRKEYKRGAKVNSRFGAPDNKNSSPKKYRHVTMEERHKNNPHWHGWALLGKDFVPTPIIPEETNLD